MFVLKVLTLAFLFGHAAVSALESRARQNFNCDDILNQQISKEFNAAQTYLSLASYFAHDRIALEGFAKMFEHSWKEEIGHGQKLIEYGLMRGSKMETPSVSKPDDKKWEKMNACEIVSHALDMEKSINAHLLQVHKCGDGDKVSNNDPQLQDFIEGDFLNEQVKGAKELSDLLSRLERTTMHVNSNGEKKPLCDGLGLHIIDQELAKKYGK